MYPETITLQLTRPSGSGDLEENQTVHGIPGFALNNLPHRTSMKTGIIGLPQVGKTSLFKILTKAKLE
ncbi:MAG: hypothetical protein WBF45_08140, partial [Acidobacteriaceae bacterium]